MDRVTDLTGAEVSKSNLITPFGGDLVDLVASAEAAAELRAEAGRLPSIQISERAVCDLELLATGGFSPLDQVHVAG